MRDSTTRYPNPHEDRFAEWARSEGWRVTKQGWPDFICRRAGEVMAVEVKGGNDGLRPEQIDAIRDLQRAGFPTWLWTPEWGLREVPTIPLLDPTPSLSAEIARLQGVIRELTEQPRAPEPPPDVRVRLPDEDAMARTELTEMCVARHGHSHDRGERMPRCAWLFTLSNRMSQAQMAAEMGIEPEIVERDLAFISDHLAKFFHRMRHKQLNRAGLRCQECVVSSVA